MTTRHEFYIDGNGKLKERSQNKPKRLPPHVIRKLNMAPTGPGFVCPKCNERFKMQYGTFGRVRWGTEPRYYCKDCAKDPKFTKAR